ncbi:PX domain-containing protein 1 isoform X1 [Siniperca chuatsi]|uniref:PX domain-containing protein 1 isoform X1 n=1 Tax=Siniperca chuatsi TaxID=119488 RepID=UPI001CE135BA|nr:PX domain-containing protein 1 isoform X1 [Siniperca chuatsi]
MASAVFEGTSLVNMFVRDCWVNGIRRLIISQRGEEEEFFEIRTEWSDRNILYLHRSYSDLGRLFKRLIESFPEDRRDLSKSPLIEGLVKIKEANDIEEKLNEVERLLKNAINMPCKYSRSEVMLTFFERSPLDQVLRNDKVHRIQPCFQSPIKISVSLKKKRDPHPLTLWNICMRMEQSFCQWKQMCVMRKQKRMSPTFPTTICSHLKLTSWNEEPMPVDRHMTLSLRNMYSLNGTYLYNAAHSCSK